MPNMPALEELAITVLNAALLAVLNKLMRGDAKGALKSGGKVGGMSVTTGVGGLLHAITVA